MRVATTYAGSSMTWVVVNSKTRLPCSCWSQLRRVASRVRFEVGDVAEPTRHLDHHVGCRKLEVHPDDAGSSRSVHHLRVRSGQAVFADESQKPSFEVRLASAVEEEFPQERRPWPTEPDGVQPVREGGDGGTSSADGAVDRVGEKGGRLGAGRIEDGPRDVAHPEPVVAEDVTAWPVECRVQGHPRYEAPA